MSDDSSSFIMKLVPIIIPLIIFTYLQYNDFKARSLKNENLQKLEPPPKLIALSDKEQQNLDEYNRSLQSIQKPEQLALHESALHESALPQGGNKKLLNKQKYKILKNL